MSGIVDQLRSQAAASLFPTDGELRVDGLGAPIDVRFDRWGVAYVSAASLDDLWFAQGFISAGERLFQIDLALRAANGRLSELFADRTVPEDRFARVVGFHRAGRAYAASWSAESRAMVERFVQGVHAWIRAMPAVPIEYTLLDISPELPLDLAAWASCWAYLAWGLSGNMDQELMRAELVDELGPELAGTLMPPAVAIAPAIAAGGLAGKLLSELPRTPPGLGSNNWVLAGSRTTSGKPLLANDPHLLVQQPSPWLELHLRAPGYEARGVALPFFPAIAIGRTAHHAWGVTNVTGDVQDLFLERLSDDGRAALFDDTWEPLRVTPEEIHVRGTAEPVVVDVRETRHGPILGSRVVGEVETEHVPLADPYALSWTGHVAGIEPTAFVEIAGATSFETFREAVSGLACPGQNFIYADVDGHIGYQCTGLYPLRRSGDGLAPAEGWTSDHEWDGWLAFEELPWSKDPECGYIVTANNRIHDEDYPHLIGNDFHGPSRAARIAELIEAREHHDVESTRAIQFDTVAPAAREVLRKTKDLPGELEGWDGDMRADSRAAGFFARWIDELASRVVGDGDLLRHYLMWREDFVGGALPVLLDEDGVQTSTGGIEPGAWGEMHGVRFAHPLASIPGLDQLFVAAEHPLGGADTVQQGGYEAVDGAFPAAVVASWRSVWDLADPDAGAAVLTTGQSGNPASPHWNDQNPLWANGELREAPFTQAAIEAASASGMRLSP